jgi:chromosome segregation ATPase
MGNHTSTHCHCGAKRETSDHCDFCGCEEFEGMCGYDHLHALEQDNASLREANREWADEAERLREDHRKAAQLLAETQTKLEVERNLRRIKERHIAHAEADGRDWQHRCVQLKQQLTDADRATLDNARRLADAQRDNASLRRDLENMEKLVKFQGDTGDILLGQIREAQLVIGRLEDALGSVQ